MPNSTSELRQEFRAHQGRYGSPCLHVELRDRGRAHRSQTGCQADDAPAGLYAKRKRRRALTTHRDLSHPVAPTILNREFTAQEPNKKWVTDITYISTMQGWLYLAVIVDLYSRMVVGWSTSSNCDEKLVEHALDQALARRRPTARLLHHSDRGMKSHFKSVSGTFRRIWNTIKYVM